MTKRRGTAEIIVLLGAGLRKWRIALGLALVAFLLIICFLLVPLSWLPPLLPLVFAVVSCLLSEVVDCVFRWKAGKVIVLVLSAFLSYVWLCGGSPIAIPKEAVPREMAENCSKLRPSHCKLAAMDTAAGVNPAADFIKLEAKKINDEISANHVTAESSFQYRFTLVGGLFGGLFYLARRKKDENRTPDEMRSDPWVLLALGSACVVSIMIDANVRAAGVSTDYIAQWLYLHAEPALLSVSQDCCPYEAWLRVPNGMHADQWYRNIFWPHLQFVTAFLYAGYLYVFLEYAKRPAQGAMVVAQLMFLLVHVALLMFTVSAHYAPGGWGTQSYWPFYGDDTAVYAWPNILCRGLPIMLVFLWVVAPTLCRPGRNQLPPAERVTDSGA